MNDDIETLRQALAAAENRAREAEDRALDERRLREDEQRLREKAEFQAKTSQPQTLVPYLEACHSIRLAIEVVTNPTCTTQGDTTNPTGRIYPRRIVQWHDFPTIQEEIWSLLPSSFRSHPGFPSQTQMDYVRSLLSPISSEDGLRYFDRDTLEHPVRMLIDAVNHDAQLQGRLGLRGTISFESHTNLGDNIGDLTKSLDFKPLGQHDDAGSAMTTPPPPSQRPARVPPRKVIAGTKGGRADQFCIYGTPSGIRVPKAAIEYKAPHKLTQDELIAGLSSEIQPDRDIINKEGTGFFFSSRALTAAVITQLFSYMVGRGIQYGYVSTGQALVFLHIPDDPTTAYCHLSVPSVDVLDNDTTRLHRTAVAQVFALILQSLRTESPQQSWFDAAAKLDTWAVEYDDVLSKIPETDRKNAGKGKGKEPHELAYKARPWRGFTRSPIRTRSQRCQSPDTNPRDNNESSDSDGSADPPSPSPTPQIRSAAAKKAGASSSGSTSTAQGGQQQGKGRKEGRGGQQRKRKIQDQPYCTQQCLLGLAYGRPVDKNCPNASSHGPNHITRAEFLHRLRTQLAVDRGRDADACPLYISGAVGALFKVCLSRHGYTVVAKGVEYNTQGRLRHERRVYDHLRTVQGRCVPVCLGLIDLVLPYYYDGGAFEYFLLLGWAGRPLRSASQISQASATSGIARAFGTLHQLRVLHGDAEARNVTVRDDGGLMIVDFERAKVRGRTRQPLEPASPNSPGRKRKRGISLKREDGLDEKEGGGGGGGDDGSFARELESITASVARCFGGTGGVLF